jgi:hypothetical protein
MAEAVDGPHRTPVAALVADSPFAAFLFHPMSFSTDIA